MNFSKENLEQLLLERSGCESIEDFLNPKIYPVKNLDVGSELIMKHVHNNGKIAVVTDYDSDGVTSSICMHKILDYYKANFHIIVPDRKDGYGLSKKTIEKIDEGITLLITVDNGIVSVDDIKNFREKGVDVLVIDHHLPRADGELPNAIIINPNANEDDQYKNYSACGLVLLLAEKMLKESSYELQMIKVYAMISTISDMMNINGHNRLIIKDGLNILNNDFNIDTELKTLINLMKLQNINETDIAFGIAPLINSASRMLDDGANLIYEFLSGKKYIKDDIIDSANYFIEVNNDRKKYVYDIFESVKKEYDFNELNPIIVYVPNVKPGVVGLIAGKISEKTFKKTIVLTDSIDNPDILTGSGRSKVEPLIDFLNEHSSFFYKYGGHKFACGLSMYKQNLNSFIEDSREDPVYHDKNESYDFEIKEDQCYSCLQEVKKYGPYGMGLERPTFLIKNLILTPKNGKKILFMGDEKNHVKIYARTINIVKFFVDEDEIIEKANKVDVIGNISENYYEDKKELIIEAKNIQTICEESKKTNFFNELNDLFKF